MSKKERLLSLIHSTEPQVSVPAAFFLHFPPECHVGEAAVRKHIEFFRATDMDFVKVQLELPFPRGHVDDPKDWAKLPHLKKDFFADELAVIEGIVQELSREALVLVTLYSPYMVAVRFGGERELNRDIMEEPEYAGRAIEIAAESLLGFIDACVKIGVDGFYHSTQGGQESRFPDPRFFERCIKPYDLQVMREIEAKCRFNILHICDYERSLYGGYPDLELFRDYPGHVVNCSLDGRTCQEVSDFFGRPFMGGMDRTGVLANGLEAEARHEAARVLGARSQRFILGADCTVPSDTPWANLRAAVDEAHRTGAAARV